MRSAVIVSTARTPIGRAYRGAFNDTQSQALGGHVIAEAVKRAGVAPAEIDDVIMGSALQQGAQGSNIARQAALRAGLPDSVAGMSVDRQCASGMMAIATAAKQILHDDMQITVGGGVESISLVQTNAMNLTRARDPELMAHVPGLYMAMIETAELVADRYKISREAQDEYALRSQQRTAAGQQSGAFDDEIVPMPSVMLATDRNTGETSEKERQPGQGRRQPSGNQPGRAGFAEAGVQGRPDRQRGKIHYRRQCLAIVRWRVGRGADGGGGSVSPRLASVGHLPRHGGGGLRTG